MLGDLGDRIVLKADIEDLAVDLLVRRLEHQLIGVDHVLDVQVRAHLIAAKNRDHAFVYGVIGQDVDRQVEPRARAVAANRRRTDNHAGEIVGLMLPQIGSHMPFEFVVERQRNQRMIFGHVGRIRHAVDRTRRTIDEAPTPAFLAAITNGSKQS